MHPLLLLAVAGCAAAAPAFAHVVLHAPSAPAGGSYKAVFQVTHGCGASATRQLIVDVPAAVPSARPMPKPGWKLELERAGERVTRITWTARGDDKLPSAFYDEFVLVARMPAFPARVYWPWCRCAMKAARSGPRCLRRPARIGAEVAGPVAGGGPRGAARAAPPLKPGPQRTALCPCSARSCARRCWEASISPSTRAATVSRWIACQ